MGYSYALPNGRTIAAAAEAGDWYIVSFRSTPDGRWQADSVCPGTTGPAEALQAARANFPHRIGQPVDVSRVLPGSRIGCMLLDHARKAVL